MRVLPGGRSYRLHVSPGALAAGDGRFSALVVLHGLDDDPAQAEYQTQFSALADRVGFVVAYPAGVDESWNAGTCCGRAAAAQVDDVGFLTEVVLDLRRLGAARTGMAGFSNGAMMAYRFGCARPDLVPVVGIVAGSLQVPSCRLPVGTTLAVLHIHGLRDSVVPYQGLRWSARLHSGIRPVATEPGVVRGGRVTLRLVRGLGHQWPNAGDGHGVDASAEIWAAVAASAPPGPARGPSGGPTRR